MLISRDSRERIDRRVDRHQRLLGIEHKAETSPG